MGTLLGIATRPATKRPMETHEASVITLERGVGDDARGRPGGRQVTILAREAWAEACDSVGTADLPWTTRRANILVEGVALAETTGCRLRIGPAVLKVTGETVPCGRMESQCAGLKAALEPSWRGGVTAQVIEGGPIRVGDPVEIES